MLKIVSLVKQYVLFSILWTSQLRPENIPGLLLFIDFQNVFDSVDGNFSLRVLKSLTLVETSFNG